MLASALCTVNKVQSHDIHPGHVTDDLVDTWSYGPPAGMVLGIGASLSYRSVLPPDSLPHTGSRRVTFDEVALSSPQRQGVVDAVSIQLHASPTPAPLASIPTHLIFVGPVPHASASGLIGPPTCGRPEYHDAAPAEIAHDESWPPYQDIRDLAGAIPRQQLTSVYFPFSPPTSSNLSRITCPPSGDAL